MNVENLREAVWMMFFRDEAQKIQVHLAVYPIPERFRSMPVIPFNGTSEDDLPGWVSTSQSFLLWRWVPPQGAEVTGTVTWPNSSDAAEDYTASLLDVAEQSFTDRCVSRGLVLPASALSGNTVSLNENRSDVPAIAKLQIELRDRLNADFDLAVPAATLKWKSLPRCKR